MITASASKSSRAVWSARSSSSARVLRSAGLPSSSNISSALSCWLTKDTSGVVRLLLGAVAYGYRQVLPLPIGPVLGREKREPRGFQAPGLRAVEDRLGASE